jgi:CRISPR-associated protein Cmr3
LRLCLTEEADLVPWEGTLEAKDYRRYLLGELDGQKLAEESRLSRDLVRADLRLGIERDRVRGTVQRGRLYMAHFHRPTAGVGLAAEVWVKDGSSGPPLKRKGYLALGGEARAARYRTIQSPLGDLEDEGFKEALRKRLEKGRRFKLVLATPTVLAHGWCPGFVERNLKGAVAGVPVRLVAATVGKALPVGGWDFGGRKPKPLRLAAPAGSVFHFEVANEARDGWPDALLQQVHGKSLCDGPLETRWGDYRRVPGHEVGMGITFVGVWDGV